MKHLQQWLIAVCLISFVSGCQSVPWAKKSKPGEPPELAAMRNQIQQYQSRTSALEASNSQVNIQLAQTQQQLLGEQQANKRGGEYYKQLYAENEKLKKERVELIAQHNEMVRRIDILADSVKVQGTTAIVPNSSNTANVDFSDMSGISARRDGQMYRVIIPSDNIFEENQPILSESGKQTISTVAQRLASAFGQRQFRIEAHVGSIQTVSTGDPSTDTPQKLTVAQASAVSDAVIQAGAIPAESLSIMGCGVSQPAVSSATDEGRQMNKRIEFVVLP